jgi:hypothetical protein
MPTNLYINQSVVLNQQFQQQKNCESTYHKLFGKNWKFLKSCLLNYPTTSSWYPRFGSDIPGFHTQTLIDANFGINFTHDVGLCNQTFANVTDQRLHQLWQTHSDKPWLISWSGGIDSTVIVVSVLKHLTPQQRKNFAVLCDPGSVWENPKFFYQYILPNFSVVDSTDSYTKFEQYKNQYYIIEGDPADCIWGYRAVPYLGELANQPWRNCCSDLVDRLTAGKDFDRSAAQWQVDMLESNISSVDLPIDTVAQWYWWFNYNFQYIDAVMRKVVQGAVPLKDIEQYFVHWYHNQDYNCWSVDQNINFPAPGVPELYKHQAKKYIAEIYKDNYFASFKGKGSSGSRSGNPDKWMAIQENQTFCYEFDSLI